MTGTGTQEDPYIVDSWADYRAVYGSEVYIEWDDENEEKIVDFNEIKPDGFTETVYFSPFTTFNGWTFKNFFSTHPTCAIHFGSRSTTLENFTFLNFYWQPTYSSSDGNFLYSLASGTVELKNCSFSGRIDILKGEKNFSYNKFLFNASSLNIVVNSLGNFIIFKYNVKNSDLMLDITAPTVTIAYGSAVNSRFSGKISSENVVNLCNDRSGYNVYNLESETGLKYLGGGVSVYNSGISASSQTDEEMESLGINFKGCTAEQLKNANYLYNLHFPIGVD